MDVSRNLKHSCNLLISSCHTGLLLILLVFHFAGKTQSDKQFRQLDSIINDAKTNFAAFKNGSKDTVYFHKQDSTYSRYWDIRENCIDSSERERIQESSAVNNWETIAYYIDFPLTESEQMAMDRFEKWKKKLQTWYKEDRPPHVEPPPESSSSFSLQISQDPWMSVGVYFLESRRNPGMFRVTLVLNKFYH